MSQPGTAEFLAAFVLAAAAGTAVFFHAERHEIKHPSSWASAVFLFLAVALPLYLLRERGSVAELAQAILDVILVHMTSQGNGHGGGHAGAHDGVPPGAADGGAGADGMTADGMTADGSAANGSAADDMHSDAYEQGVL